MKSKGRYGQFVRWIFSIVDLLIVNLTFLASMYYWQRSTTPVDSNGLYSRPVWLVLNVAMVVGLYFYSNVHERRVFYAEKVVGQAVKLVLTHAGIFVTLTSFLGPSDAPWQPVLWFYVVFFIVLSTWWVISRQFVKLYRNRGFNFKRVIVIGGGTVGVRLINEMLADQGYGYHIVGFFDDNPKARSASAAYQGTLNDVEPFVKTHQVDEMFCAVPDIEDNQNVSRMIRIADNNAVDFYYVPQFGRTVTRQFELQSVGDVPILAVHPYPLKNPINRFVKRTFDLLVSTIVLILSPLVIIPIAIGIKLSSPGPIFFVQKRTGYRGQAFDCYKFRTMRLNDDSDTKQAVKGDPRVTRFGNFLRRTSIDELPQFYNVWRGEMSIVGPRPHMVAQTELYSELIDKYMLRHTIKPGITGWAQVRGYRGQTEELWQMEKRVEYDVWYAENWTFFMDLKIIFRTVWNALKGEDNAY
ncbi:MAG: undecaprenyl-phosphate glucose phosphotransferase [Muribaculaceae bacterium]|nr:undecaprenyl-phosphate glucose phosphotransferase [Muribaculaceae bacterium]